MLIIISFNFSLVMIFYVLLDDVLRCKIVQHRYKDKAIYSTHTGVGELK